MTSPILSCLLTLAVLGALGLPASARAETRACTPVTSLPAELDIAKVYCLTQDLTTSIASGTAIKIGEADIVLDCNGYKIGGLGGGPASQAKGIATDAAHTGVVVRNCSVRGFRTGIDLAGDAVRAEGNRLDGNLSIGIRATGRGVVLARNRVFDTGDGGNASGIVVVGSGQLLDNFVTGVDGTLNDGVGNTTGLSLGGSGPLVLERNRVRGVVAATDLATATAMAVTATPVLSMRDNWLVGSSSGDFGIRCASTTTIAHSGTTAASFTTPYSGCGPDLP